MKYCDQYIQKKKEAVNTEEGTKAVAYLRVLQNLSHNSKLFQNGCCFLNDCCFTVQKSLFLHAALKTKQVKNVDISHKS